MRISKSERRVISCALAAAILLCSQHIMTVRAFNHEVECKKLLTSLKIDNSISSSTTQNKQVESITFSEAQERYQESLTHQNSAEVAENKINISTSKFSSTSIRLNTELYDETADIVNVEHIKKDYGSTGTNLYESYLEYIDPIMALALTTCETQSWSDSRYTWCSAIYSKLLAQNGTDMDNLDIEEVNIDTYIVAGLTAYLGCGSNCTASLNDHYHESGNNDNDSLGPLQILRRYVESSGYISYPCGEVTYDLMCWKDNVEYFVHKQSEYFSNVDFWNCDHKIGSANELMALIAVAHNTGGSYLNSKDAGSLWRDSQAVFDFCEELGSDKSYEVLSSYVDEWYENLGDTEIEQFVLAGNYYSNDYSSILRQLGMDKSSYASSFGHKQWYPLKAVLNYMSLCKLYHSGEEVN